MKAAVLTQLNAPLELLDVECGDLQFGQVLVRVIASGICGAQLLEIAGHKGNASYVPHLLGHEGVGTVEAVGAGVTRVRPGDKVVMHWRPAAGIESDFPKYRFPAPGGGRNERASGRVTTFSEFSICSENRLTPVPGDTPDELCAMLGCGLSTALGTIERDAHVKMGESVLILGAGGLGLNLVLAAKLAHAGSIAVVDKVMAKLDRARRMGADWTMGAGASSAVSAWLNHGMRGCYDVVIDTTGAPELISDALCALKPSGRFVMVGQPKPGAAVSIGNAVHLFEGEGKMIRATQGGGFRPHLDIPRYVNVWRKGRIDLDGLITHEIPLDAINDGIELVRSGEAGRVLIRINPEAAH